MLVPFTANATGGTRPYNFTWNFGDGTPPSYAANPSHTYAHPFQGLYNVTLKVVDAKGTSATDTQRLLFLYPPCAIQPGAGPSFGLSGLLLILAALALVIGTVVWFAIGRRRVGR